MKSWIYAMMIVTAGALVGCDDGKDGEGGKGGETSEGGGGAGGGTGGSTTGMTTTTTTTTTTMAKDCSEEATFDDCYTCFAEEYPDGAALYGDVAECVFCTACYTTCDGMGLGCPAPPAMKDMCDGDMPDEAACGGMMGCQACALGAGGTCNPALTACQDSADCMDFAQSLDSCPQ